MRYSLMLLLCLTSLMAQATGGTVWYSPIADTSFMDDVMVSKTSTDYVHGRGFAMQNYTRLPDSAKGMVRGEVWGLSRNSAGLYLLFTTNSTDITVQYEVTGTQSLPHMPATGVSGVDLYTDNGNRCVAGSYSFGKPVTYNYKELEGSDGGAYTLYLPLYNTIKWLKIGVREGSTFEFVPMDDEKRPVVIYGTSIAHGACASRPGMAWSNILQQRLDVPIVNLGFSGNGRLEPAMIDYLTAIPALLHIVDCMPNMYVSEDSVCRLVLGAVRQYKRTQPDTPILLTEHPGYANRHTNAVMREQDERVDRAQRRAYDELLKEGIKGLYYLSRADINMPKDGMVDTIHPTDLGMMAYAEAYQRAIRKILKLKKITLSSL